MLFNSLQFVGFFIVVTFLYYALDWHVRWKMLLIASCVFYMSFIPAYILIIFTTILIDFYMGIRIEESTGRLRLFYLQVSIVSTCLVLFIFKYAGFFEATVRELQNLLGDAQTFPITHLILPIGLSFHTFQSLSYVIEVYRGNQKSERNLGIYSLYVMFYPQLVAGPIERPQNLLHQFYEDHEFEISNLRTGLCQIAWGFFQKMVIADRCAVYVNQVYGHWETESGLALLAATILFAIQIYADFAGYSSIAIGCARVMGFKLMTNFNHPYFSRSFAEFWKRWHISLSTWFRDYVYIPLGGNRVSVPRRYLNLLVTFTISGLWHGANWTFIVWGALNGIFLILENSIELLGITFVHGQLGRLLRRLIVIVGICVGWIFFRSQNVHSAVSIIDRILTGTAINRASIGFAISQFSLDITSVAVGATTIAVIILMFIVEYVRERTRHDKRRWAIMASPRFQFIATTLLFDATLLFGSLRSSAFVYFQF